MPIPLLIPIVGGVLTALGIGFDIASIWSNEQTVQVINDLTFNYGMSIGDFLAGCWPVLLFFTSVLTIASVIANPRRSPRKRCFKGRD